VICFWLFNRIRELERVPNQWSTAQIFVLFKATTGKVDNPSDYRAICLLSVVSKLLEKILAVKASSMAEEKGLLSDIQHAFRVRRSTID
jgi:hypothetical protein